MSTFMLLQLQELLAATAAAFRCRQPKLAIPSFLAWVAALHESLQQTAESNMSQHMTAFHSRPLETTSLILDRRRPHGRGKNGPCAAAVPPPLPTRQAALAHKQHVLGHTPYFVPSHTPAWCRQPQSRPTFPGRHKRNPSSPAGDATEHDTQARAHVGPATWLPLTAHPCS